MQQNDYLDVHFDACRSISHGRLFGSSISMVVEDGGAASCGDAVLGFRRVS
jgi:hypothetical protein